MKFGFRQPSFKKSLSATTKGRVTRTINKILIPGYGRKGVGILNPKRWTYNKLYNSMTINAIKTLSKSLSSSTQINYKNISTYNFHDYNNDLNLLKIRKVGLQQVNIIIDFTTYSNHKQINPSIRKAISKLNGRCDQYINKGKFCGEDLFEYAIKSISELKNTAFHERTKYECSIALEIIDLLKKNQSNFEDIITLITNKYPYYTDTPVSSSTNSVTKNTIPEEILNNSNGKNEGEVQSKILMQLLNNTKIGKYKTIVYEMNVIIANTIYKYCISKFNNRINLYDFAIFTLTEHKNSLKTEKRKEVYNLTIDIIKQLSLDNDINKILDYLRKNFSTNL